MDGCAWMSVGVRHSLKEQFVLIEKGLIFKILSFELLLARHKVCVREKERVCVRERERESVCERKSVRERERECV